MSERLFDINEVPRMPTGTDMQKPYAELPSGWEPEVKPRTNQTPEITINHEQVNRVLGTLLNAYENRRYPYNHDSVRLPHDPRHMPPSLEYGSVDHAMFFWNACYYMRGGIKSVDAIKRLAAVYEEEPDLFDCAVASEKRPAEIAGTLKAHGLGFQGTASRHWVENAQRLHERFDGDPRKIFTSNGTYDDYLKIIKNDGKGGGFKGFQEKMTSMIIYYLMDSSLIEPFMFPIPVDLHVMRVSVSNRLIEWKETPYGTDLYSDQMLATLRELYYDYAVEHEVNPLRLCDAVWLLSESLCGSYPGNITLEPYGRSNRKGRSTVLLPQEVDTNSPAQQAAYEASCRHCPVEETCDYAIPGKLYYVAGGLIIRGLRKQFPEPPQTKMFTIEQMEH